MTSFLKPRETLEKCLPFPPRSTGGLIKATLLVCVFELQSRRPRMVAFEIVDPCIQPRSIGIAGIALLYRQIEMAGWSNPHPVRQKHEMNNEQKT